MVERVLIGRGRKPAPPKEREKRLLEKMEQPQSKSNMRKIKRELAHVRFRIQNDNKEKSSVEISPS